MGVLLSDSLWVTHIYRCLMTSVLAALAFVGHVPWSKGEISCVCKSRGGERLVIDFLDVPMVTDRCFFDHTPQSSVPLLARALSPWSATSETHLSLSSGSATDVITTLLSFSQGDIISVLQQREDWWLGQINGMQGWFPKSYVALETAGNTE